MTASLKSKTTKSQQQKIKKNKKIAVIQNKDLMHLLLTTSSDLDNHYYGQYITH